MDEENIHFWPKLQFMFTGEPPQPSSSKLTETLLVWKNLSKNPENKFLAGEVHFWIFGDVYSELKTYYMKFCAPTWKGVGLWGLKVVIFLINAFFENDNFEVPLPQLLSGRGTEF